MTKQQTGVCERCNGPILEAGQKQHGLSRECIEYLAIRLEDELCEPALQKGLSIRREVSKARSEPLRYVDVFIAENFETSFRRREDWSAARALKNAGYSGETEAEMLATRGATMGDEGQEKTLRGQVESINDRMEETVGLLNIVIENLGISDRPPKMARMAGPEHGSDEWLDLVFREAYLPTETQLLAHRKVQEAGKEFAKVIRDLVPACADRTVAIRKVREALVDSQFAIRLEGRAW